MLVQEGRRDIFETIVQVQDSRHELTIEEDAADLDGLNYLAGETVDFVNKKPSRYNACSHRWRRSKLSCEHSCAR